MSRSEIESIFVGKKPDRSYRAKEISEITNYAIRKKANVLVMPEAYVPLRYLSLLGKKAARSQMMIICGIEHIVERNSVWNLTCTIVPFEIDKVKYAIPFFRQKNYFSPKEQKYADENHLHIPNNISNALFSWGGYSFATYCCYELTAIRDRSEFINDVEVIYGIELNEDINYFSNIMESLSRDMYCYCVQSNMSEYGDSRIIAPAHSYNKNIMKVSGGDNAAVLIGTIDLMKLRESKTDAEKRDKYKYAALPAGLDNISNNIKK